MIEIQLGFCQLRLISLLSEVCQLSFDYTKKDITVVVVLFR